MGTGAVRTNGGKLSHQDIAYWKSSLNGKLRGGEQP